MRTRSRTDAALVRACRAAGQLLRAHGLEVPVDARALELQLAVLDRLQLARVEELQARAEQLQSLAILDQADEARRVAQCARDHRAELLARLS